MNFTKATDEQLKTIIEGDVGVPTPLLKKAYEEAMNRNLYKAKIIYFIVKQFGSREKTEQATGQTVEDLMWICYELGYEKIERYQSDKPYEAYWHRAMINEILMAARKNNALKRKGNTFSLEDTYEWSIPGGNHVEPIALNRIYIESLMNQLTEIEKDIVIKRYQGYSLREIAEMQGMSKGGIVKRIELYQKRLKGA